MFNAVSNAVTTGSAIDVTWVKRPLQLTMILRSYAPHREGITLPLALIECAEFAASRLPASGVGRVAFGAPLAGGQLRGQLRVPLFSPCISHVVDS